MGKVTIKIDEGQGRHGLKQNPTYVWYVILEQGSVDAVIRYFARFVKLR